MRIIVLSILFLTFITLAVAEEIKSSAFPDIKTELKNGEGIEKVKTLCNICHSLDYITMQPPFSKEQWASIVNKMRRVFGAPIMDSDAEIIIRYLSTNYGK
jgi:hypothetical protein